MKLMFLVEVELNDAEFENLNAKRKKFGSPPHTPAGWIENNIHFGLEQKGIDKVVVAPAIVCGCACGGNAICSQGESCRCE